MSGDIKIKRERSRERESGRREIEGGKIMQRNRKTEGDREKDKEIERGRR